MSVKKRLGISFCILFLLSSCFANVVYGAEPEEKEERGRITIEPIQYSEEEGVKVGQTARFTVSVENTTVEHTRIIEKNIVWMSYDSDIVEMKGNGYVYAVSPGTVMIRAYYLYDPDIEAEYMVHVYDDVSSFSLGKIPKKMKISETVQITPIFYSEDKKVTTTSKKPEITWESSNQNIATVSPNGLVTAIRPGTVTIAAYAFSLGKEKKCTIKISRPAALSIKNISQTRTGIKISWNKKRSADGYLLERKVGNKAWSTLVDETDRVSYDDENVKKGQRYQYRLAYYKEYNGRWILSKKSTWKKTIFYYGGKPERPIITESRKAKNGYHLEWSGVSDADYIEIWMKKGGSGWEILQINGKDFSAKTTDYVDIRKDLYPTGVSYMKVRTYRVVKGKKYFSPYSETIKIQY